MINDMKYLEAFINKFNHWFKIYSDILYLSAVSFNFVTLIYDFILVGSPQN